MASWEGKVATLRERYQTGAEDLTIRNRLALKWLESRGRIVTNCSAEYTNESVQKAEPPVEAHGEAGVIDFARHNLWDQARMGWRGYVATDLMYEQEKMEAKGDVVLVNRYAKIMDHLTKGLRNQIHNDLYINGGASGNTLKIEGLQTALNSTTSTTAAADKYAGNTGTYRNISTIPFQEGSWSSDLTTSPNTSYAVDWPDGTGNSECDYWTGKLVKTNGTGWGTGSGSWEEECESILSEVNVTMHNLANTTGSELVFISDGRMNTQFKAKMRARNYHLMPLKSAVDLGFPEVLSYEGLGIHYEYGIDANRGFIWNFEHTELCSLAPSLLFSRGPDYAMELLAWRFLIGFYGNLKISPKFFAHFYPFATT